MGAIQGASMSVESDGLDLAGLGKIAEAIPEEVYIQTSEAVTGTFKKLVAPVTETTAGFGRLIQQKFDNMVEAEKALAVHAVQKAKAKAEAKAREAGLNIITPVHPKSFIKSVEEASKETDSLLHEMWTSLLADQLINEKFHPHFVGILANFSPAEARLLMSLLPKDEVGVNGGRYINFTDDSFKHWVRQSRDGDLNEWDYSCILLHEFRFANLLAPKDGDYSKEDKVTILYRTEAGNTFLSAVS